MSGYVKVFSSILDSTVWLTPPHVRLVWITMLAMADRDGVVEASVPGLANRAGVERAQCDEALAMLSAPDPDSRTPDEEGRRIRKVDGGWELINHAKYRKRMDADERRERDAARKNRQRSEEAEARAAREQPSEPVRTSPQASEPVRTSPQASEPVRACPSLSEPVRDVRTSPQPSADVHLGPQPSAPVRTCPSLSAMSHEVSHADADPSPSPERERERAREPEPPAADRPPLDEFARLTYVRACEKRRITPSREHKNFAAEVWRELHRFGHDTSAITKEDPRAVIKLTIRGFLESEAMRLKGYPTSFLAQNPLEFLTAGRAS